MSASPYSSLICLVACVAALGPAAGLAGGSEEPYEPSWKSLNNHQCPEWFRDAKFGIYTHWGPVTVGAQDGPSGVQWYGRNMYMSDSPVFEYHRKRFGNQNEFGYKDVVRLFRAEKFDAEAWAALFAEAGAKFAGPVAIHHDNFAMWDSALTRWDSMDGSPKRDFTGELERAVRKRGMKFIATFHHSFSWQYYEPAYRFDARTGEYAGLYCEPHEPGAAPSRKFLDTWLGLVNEVVAKYKPDLIWFDFGLGKLIPAPYQQRMFADYYNWAARRGVEVGVAHKHRDIHAHTGILDFERGREDALTPYPWLTDTSVGPWFNQRSARFKSVDEIVDVLVDIVSKNGCMLLNVGPDAAGEIPPRAQEILRGIGRWLKVNGEAIYGTRPWLVFGEGPTRNSGGGFSENKDKPYGAGDVRFTRSKDGSALYVIVLGGPPKRITVRSIKAPGAGSKARIRLLGCDAKVRFRANAEGQLVIETPELSAEELPCENAFAFKLSGWEVSMHEAARFQMPGAISLPVEHVTLEGDRIRVQPNGGRPNIGAWDDASERAHWLVWIRKAGSYRVRAELSSAYGASSLKASLAGGASVSAVPRTDGWFKPVFVGLGRFKVERPGVYRLTLEPAAPATWKAVNVWQLQVAPGE